MKTTAPYAVPTLFCRGPSFYLIMLDFFFKTDKLKMQVSDWSIDIPDVTMQSFG